MRMVPNSSSLKKQGKMDKAELISSEESMSNNKNNEEENPLLIKTIHWRAYDTQIFSVQKISHVMQNFFKSIGQQSSNI